MGKMLCFFLLALLDSEMLFLRAGKIRSAFRGLLWRELYAGVQYR
jgi:hypothetical protein